MLTGITLDRPLVPDTARHETDFSAQLLLHGVTLPVLGEVEFRQEGDHFLKNLRILADEKIFRRRSIEQSDQSGECAPQTRDFTIADIAERFATLRFWAHAEAPRNSS